MEPELITHFKREVLDSKELDPTKIPSLVAKLSSAGLLSASKVCLVEFLLFEQAYLEMMDSGKTIEAIKLL